ncbi:Excinuclease ABC C subunit domain protein [Coraliomargarita akajimensis DSM 45221]|uniref:Excinuclease ABC C subunit domain protein n=2 Tax=Coraliomargarita TaxID=442430 RepID=D5EJC9_CORAD|nr:Excinuclease ABC C subunit domain protein [Coraliomargarita akajimensis DSM 45221]
MSWWVYMIRCADDSLYAGVATDVERRFAEHAGGGPKAAKYLRGRGPLVLVYRCELGDRSAALKEEVRIKRLSKAEKEALVQDVEHRTSNPES